MAQRYKTFSEFWPSYLLDHRTPASRILHFIGTGIFIAVSIYCLLDRPAEYGKASVLSILIGIPFFHMESKKPATAGLLAIVIIAALAHPMILAGILSAYGWAWFSHFKIEKNRPATFSYPLWSLVADFKMWGLMATGKLWSEKIESSDFKDRESA